MGLLLIFTAIILLILLFPVGFLVGIIVSLITHTGDRFFKNIAKAIDIFGNVLYQHLFNLTLIKNSKHKFGKFGETISSVLGKNYRDNTLSKLGYWISIKMLERFDKNHVTNSINDNV